MKPILSIITVVYNCADSIEQTIVSVLNYVTKDVEFIIVDGNSTDQTMAVIKKYEQHLHWISEKDEGIYDAMNKGIKMAKGHNLYFINCGDTVLQLPLSELNEDNNTDMHCFPVSINETKIKYPVLNWKFKLTNTLAHQGIFYKNTEDAFYNKKYKVFADYALNLDYFMKSKSIKLHTHPVVADHSTNGISYSKTSSKEFFSLVRQKLGTRYMVLSYLYFKLRGIYSRINKNIACF